MTEEVFRPIPGFEGYKVSNFGNVMGKKNTILKQCCNNTGSYPQITLFKDKKYTKTIHRLVGLVFLPNPDNLPTIDHIDRNKSNNNVNNLRWADYKTQNNNQKPFRDRKIKNKTGERYIHFNKRAKKKQYFLQMHNKHINNGKYLYKYFYTIEEAVAFRDKLINDATTQSSI